MQIGPEKILEVSDSRWPQSASILCFKKFSELLIPIYTKIAIRNVLLLLILYLSILKITSLIRTTKWLLQFPSFLCAADFYLMLNGTQLSLARYLEVEVSGIFPRWMAIVARSSTQSCSLLSLPLQSSRVRSLTCSFAVDADGLPLSTAVGR